ncbi:hypothetical protein JKP88DRAFT_251609 [Tribonema minus]|uniref:Uncharacterized protein n=1 Tax=Tribonema minus TaxID=303371 RepID=A0A836CPV4_9STRA|nr:hypothetical protein JKP88DRAFT_251609 [Tribonema minus]
MAGISSIKRSLNLYNFERVTKAQGLQPHEIAYYSPFFQQAAVQVKDVRRQLQPASVKANNAKKQLRADKRKASAVVNMAFDVEDLQFAVPDDDFANVFQDDVAADNDTHDGASGGITHGAARAGDSVAHGDELNDDFDAIAGRVAGLPTFDSYQVELAEDIAHNDEINDLLSEDEMIALMENVPDIEQALSHNDALQLQNAVDAAFRDMPAGEELQYDP